MFLAHVASKMIILATKYLGYFRNFSPKNLVILLKYKQKMLQKLEIKTRFTKKEKVKTKI